ncbi:MAG: CHAD domain-containing protein [Myxococcota bacterium]|nr:CHAD domain-containing protein [Myxococcota bacterium]
MTTPTDSPPQAGSPAPVVPVDSAGSADPAVGPEGAARGEAQAPPAASPARHSGREVELKLEFQPGDAERLREHPAFASGARGRPTTSPVRSVYYDTPELALYRRGLVLRLRDAKGPGEPTIQTVKTLGDASAGLFDRPEDEAAVPGGDPDPSVIGDAALRAAVLEETLQRGIPLEAVVETETKRTKQVVVRGESRIECAIDVGEVRTRVGATPLNELELELLEGEPADLFGVAGEILEDLSLLPATLSKPEKGFARLLGEVPAPRKAGSLHVPEDARLDDLVDAVFESCTRQIVVNRAPSLAGDDPEGVHQLRVGVRRLRSALTLFRSFLPTDLHAELREELRWLGGELGPARDLDVFLLETLEPLLQSRPDDGALKRLRDEAVAARAEAYDRVRRVLCEPRHARLIMRLGAVRAGKAWRDQRLTEHSARLFAPARDVGRELLAKRHKRVKRMGAELASCSIAELHAFRIEMKKLRYAVEFHRSLFDPELADPYIQRSSRLQDVLGTLNDVVTTERMLDVLLTRMGDECRPEHQRAAGFLLGWMDHLARARLTKLDRLWRRFRKTRVFWKQD